MSGPKHSSYSLEAEKRRQLEEQRRREREAREAKEKERKACQREQNVKNQLLQSMRHSIESLHSVKERLENLQEHTGTDNPEIRALEQAIAKAEKTVQAQEKTGITESAKMHKENDALRTADCTLAELLQKSRQSEENIRTDYHQSLDAGMSESFELVFQCKDRSPKTQENYFLQRMREEANHLDCEELSDELLGQLELIREKAASIQSADYLENFYNVLFRPFIDDCEAYKKLRAEWSDAELHYRVLCEEAGESQETFPCSAEGIREMQRHSGILEEKIRDEREKEYIRSAMDEAMSELGYHVVGTRDVKKKNGRTVRHGLYQLKAGTAVDVSFSGDGKISMELGALDTADRTPNTAETQMLVGEMRLFCKDYAKLEEILKEKGVLTQKLTVCPPTEEYAQVLNTADYTLHGNLKATEQTENKRRKTEKREMTNG